MDAMKRPAFSIEDHVAKSMDPSGMAGDEINERMRKSFHTQNAVAELLQKPALDHSHVMEALGDAVKAKVMTGVEAKNLLAAMPDDPAALRKALEGMQKGAIHASVLLTKEQMARGTKH